MDIGFKLHVLNTFRGTPGDVFWTFLCDQNQPSRGVLKKRYSENMQQIHMRTPMPEYDISIKLLSNFFEITLRHGCFPVNLLHIFRTPLLKNTSWRLLHCVQFTFFVQGVVAAKAGHNLHDVVNWTLLSIAINFLSNTTWEIE